MMWGCSAEENYTPYSKIWSHHYANKVGKADSYLIDCNRSFEITQKIWSRTKTSLDAITKCVLIAILIF